MHSCQWLPYGNFQLLHITNGIFKAHSDSTSSLNKDRHLFKLFIKFSVKRRRKKSVLLKKVKMKYTQVGAHVRHLGNLT